MTAVLILLALLLAAAVSPLLGRDSRMLDQETWARDALWSRDRVTHPQH